MAAVLNDRSWVSDWRLACELAVTQSSFGLGNSGAFGTVVDRLGQAKSTGSVGSKRRILGVGEMLR